MIDHDTPTISVIIPTLNAGGAIDNLLKKLSEQTSSISEIIIVDSESSDDTLSICKNNAAVQVINIKRSDFDHGKTRDLAFRQSKGDIVVFLTQDAIPADRFFIEKLIVPLADEHVAVSTGRQLPKADATKMEKLVRSFNYPAESHIRSKDDLPQMGIKTFFCSDVCAAYKRSIFLRLGGFEYPLKTNEDMFFAAKAINAGYCIAYAADAQVFHSHNFTLREQYNRNYIQGYEIERHRAELGKVKQESEGIKLVKYVNAIA